MIGDAPDGGQPSVGDNQRLMLHVRPDTTEWGSEDNDRWRADLADLERQLRRQLPAETLDPEVSEGTRGVAEWSEIIIALGSAGAVTAAVEIFKSWVMAKPGRRKVKVSVDDGEGQQRSVMVEADGLGAAELENLAVHALTNKETMPAAGNAQDG